MSLSSTGSLGRGSLGVESDPKLENAGVFAGNGGDGDGGIIDDTEQGKARKRIPMHNRNGRLAAGEIQPMERHRVEIVEGPLPRNGWFVVPPKGGIKRKHPEKCLLH